MTQISHTDLASVQEMREDGAAVARRLPAASPSLRYEDHAHDQPKAQIQISEAAARIAGALHLHLD